MSVSVTTALSDLSKELGESQIVSNTLRLGHYNDALIEFYNARRWTFALKKNVTLSTVANTQSYSISAITDMREPAAIKEIFLGTTGEAIVPIDYERRFDIAYSGGNYFYLDLELSQVTFLGAITSVQTITIWYYYIPQRITDLASLSTFPTPDRYRKLVAILAAAYVQWSRYLESPGNRLYNLYNKMLGSVILQQSERSPGNPKRLTHFLAWRGFRRV